jgi:hypothetical protein
MISKSNGTSVVAETAPAPVSRKLDTGTSAVVDNRKESVPPSYDEQKNWRILRQGIYQAVVQSPGLAGLAYSNLEEFLKLVETTAERLIVKVQE